MDGQLEKKDIPVNARAVGRPQGMHALYLEDYVHTFIKKMIKNDEEENGCEVFLYGYEFDEEGRHFLVVSGAYQHDDRRDIPGRIGAQYFPTCTYLGTASIHSDGISEMKMEIVRDGERSAVLNNFYVYYDQNEEMQNYLIEWNLEHRDYRGRNEFEGAVKYGRMAQAYNKEEARVGYLWNAMNILSLGLVVCIMVYGIISMNNYHKMKNMEEKISYIVSTMTENADFAQVSALISPQTEEVQEESEIFRTEIVETMPTEAVTKPEAVTEEVITMEDTMTAETDETEWESELSESTSVAETQEEELRPEETASEPAAEEATSIPQYYVVQQGDTLRSICIRVYGNLDRVEEVCAQNKITDPDSILYGQTLLLP